MRRTVDAARKASSSPTVGLIVHRMKTLMTQKSKMHDRLNAVAIMIHAV
jgi:hypothetical protein